jgi:type I restriction enzyme, S subunit
MAGGFDVQNFVDSFPALAAAKGGTGRLRGMVLDLAVRGYLIERGGDRLGPQGLFTIPAGWRWATLGEVLAKITDGTHHSPPNTASGPFMYITAKNIKPGGVELAGVTYVSRAVHEEIYSRCDPTLGDVLLIKDGATTGIVTINQLAEPFSMLSSVALLRPGPDIDAKYLVYYLRSPSFYDFLRGSMKGVAITRVTLGQLNKAPIPVPPVVEQKRIVDKVDELMRLIDDFEAKQNKKRAIQTRFRNSALDALTKVNGPEEQAIAWERVQENVPAIFDAPESVRDLRGAILTLALHGRLERHEANANAEEELIKKKPAAARLTSEESPYVLPKQWCWTRLESLVAVVTDGDHQPPPQVPAGVSFLTIGNVTSGTIIFTGSRCVPREYFDKLDPRRVPRRGDILYTVVGATYGRPVPVDDDRPFCVQRHIAILKPDGTCDREYLLLFLRSPLAYTQATNSITGTAQPTVPLKPLRRFAVPLPPFAEQRRIVAKVDALMKLCDELETKLKAKESAAERLVAAMARQMVA